MIEVIDRVSGNPNGVIITKEGTGEVINAHIERADKPSSTGTLINKNLFDSIATDLNAKAPKNHASTSTTYGVASTNKYGHVRIGTGDTDVLTKARYDTYIKKLQGKYAIGTLVVSYGISPNQIRVYEGTVSLATFTNKYNIIGTAPIVSYTFNYKIGGYTTVYNDDLAVAFYLKLGIVEITNGSLRYHATGYKLPYSDAEHGINLKFTFILEEKD